MDWEEVADFEPSSPESTVSTLLASSGYLATEPNASILYRGKQYGSASEALDAYIADFYASRQKTASCLSVTTSCRAKPHRPIRVKYLQGTQRNREVLSELTDSELDLLTLPTSSLRRRSDSAVDGRVSLTTEELLAIPSDGSMPVTKTTAFIQRLVGPPIGTQIQTLNPPWTPVPSKPGRRPPEGHRCATLATRSRVLGDFSEHAECQKGRGFREPAHLPSSSHLSSSCGQNGAEHSEVSPPSWVQDFPMEFWEITGLTPPPAPRAPSWLVDLDEDSVPQGVRSSSHEETQEVLRDRRLRLADRLRPHSATASFLHDDAPMTASSLSEPPEGSENKMGLEDCEAPPSDMSLQRALRHLTRLKSLFHASGKGPKSTHLEHVATTTGS